MTPKIQKNFQPMFRNLDWGMSSSVNVKIDAGLSLLETYHYHPQLELIALHNCKGNAMVGTRVCPLMRDEILLIGKNTPHGFFYKDQPDTTNTGEAPYAIVVQFDENFMGRDFFSIPESYSIKRLLGVARHGLLVKEEKIPIVAHMMRRMLNEQGFKKILLLLEVLSLFNETEDNHQFSKEERGISMSPVVEEDSRLREVRSFTENNYSQPIRIDEVALRVNLTKESFCRFFKAKTNMTYMEYLFAHRIDKAKANILENRMSVKEVAYSCGFLSLSTFYYQFRKIMGCSPLEYQKKLFGKL